MIKVKSITVTYSEAKRMRDKVFTSVKEFNAAVADTVRDQLHDYPNGDSGYDKTGFHIVWEDGEDYIGRLDISPKERDLGEHVRAECKFVAGIKPVWMKDEDYTVLHKHMGQASIAQAKKFLEGGYELFNE